MTFVLNSSVGGNFLSRYASRSVAERLPRRFKRLLYVGSAMGMLLKTRHPDIDLVERVNQRLKLAYGASAILFPIYIGSKIWKDVINNIVELQRGEVSLADLKFQNLCDADCWKTGVFLAQRSPEWLNYGSPDLMAADVHDMLSVVLKTA